MADHYTIIQRHEGEHVSLELWGGRQEVRTGYHVGDLIELYGDDERDDARIHCKALNHDLTTDLAAWMQEPDRYEGARCMCVVTNCRPPVRGPGCPHFSEHCRKHIAHTDGVPGQDGGTRNG